MMKPDVAIDHRSRRIDPRKDAIETTSQMHTLDYNHDNLHDEYYNIAAVTSSTFTPKQQQQQQHHERSREENVASTTTATTGNQRSNNSSSNKYGWFSLPWSKNSHTNTNHPPQQLVSNAMTSITEETNLHDPINTTITDLNNDHDDNIVPSSPKRRVRKFNLLESTTIPESYSKVKMILQSYPNHDDSNDDTTTTRTEMEYSSLHEPPPHQQQQSRTTSNSISTDPQQDDYSFFFRSDASDDNSRSHQHPSTRQQHPPSSPHVWKTIRRDQYKRHNNAGQSIMYEYSDAVAVTPMPILQQYRTKYAQLNSELITERGSRRHRQPQQQMQPSQQYRYFDYNNDHDHHHIVLEQQRDPFDDWHMEQSSLQLQEYDTTTKTAVNNTNSVSNEFVPESLPYYSANNAIPRTGVPFSTPRYSNTTHGIVRSDTARQSSLFFMADGRMLMRLPRDRVRLLVDPDLEVGVLSVEQWRVATDIVTNHETTDCTNNDESNVATNHDTARLTDDVPQRHMPMERNESSTPLPELRYVLTVGDDLYRKIVEEMSPTNIKYFCCTRGCCNDEEKVDIRIAFVLFGMTLLILFINMLAFREH